ncbi:DUF726-domain-containing protein [Pseudovirgaria hyperparasitica]|uniref:DUF726-domain-containing protein n=1 Tax=Pseudovirgaria hyperparasitica TaxID=470096 RepID=A0A6A6WHN1_9PEZI|nr:DUF726-domain-containing protein [Pseudovirgaria hyperparasitica]KAF2762312.1 DUF726-domain-containing protein [Pseudovirgaria hyperparasitica]
MLKNLPWSPREEASPAGSHEDGQSLTSILETAELRGELTLLVVACTEVMRESLINTFGPNHTGNPADQTPNVTGDDALQNINVGPAILEVEVTNKECQDPDRREKGFSTPRMQELQADALQYFDDWRDSVVTRLGSTINAKETAQKQAHELSCSDSPNQHERLIQDEVQPGDAAEAAMKKLYPVVDTPLTQMAKEKRALVLHSILLIMLSLEHYSAHSRILLLRLTTSLNLSMSFLAEHETQIARGLLEAAQKQMNADEETKTKANENKSARKWKVGLASVAGAAVIGITGGLAAPLLAAGIGSVMGGLGLGATAAAGYLGALASSSVLVGGLFGAYGARMTGQMMDQYAKEVVTPWRIIGPSIEGFALRYELEALLALGNSISTLVKSAAWSFAKSEIMKRTILASLTAGLWPIGLLKVSRILDNPFSVARSRSEKAGEVLADALINKAQGERPVTLVGYSLGARVIYKCLQTLADRKAFGLVESVALLGAPTPSTASDWRRMRAVVSGRVVNAYSTNDYMLGFLYRTSSIQYGVAGLQAISGVSGVENIDVSNLVKNHLQYRYLSGRILREIGFEDINVEEAEIEEQEGKEEELYEEKHREYSEKERAMKNDASQVTEMKEEVNRKDTREMADRTNKISAGSRAAGLSKGGKDASQDGSPENAKENTQ